MRRWRRPATAAAAAHGGWGWNLTLQRVQPLPLLLLLTPARHPSLATRPAQGTSSTLTRSEVRGGGRKPYKQKGSGNARRGTRRSPLMPGGGISFGPKVRRPGGCPVVVGGPWLPARRPAHSAATAGCSHARRTCLPCACAAASAASLLLRRRRRRRARPARAPQPRDWSIQMNKKERKLALATALQSAAADMLACADFGAMEAVSTKALVGALGAMGVQPGQKVLLIVNEPNEKVRRVRRAYRTALMERARSGPRACGQGTRGQAGAAGRAPLPRAPPTARPTRAPQVYLSGRNIPTLAINTANAVNVSAAPAAPACPACCRRAVASHCLAGLPPAQPPAAPGVPRAPCLQPRLFSYCPAGLRRAQRRQDCDRAVGAGVHQRVVWRRAVERPDVDAGRARLTPPLRRPPGPPPSLSRPRRSAPYPAAPPSLPPLPACFSAPPQFHL